MKAYELRNRLKYRDTPFRILIEEDFDHDPRHYDCYTEEDYKKFENGEWRAWEYLLYRACPEHIGADCPGAEIVDSLCGIDVAHDTDLSGDYSSPYFIEDDYVRWLVWDAWQSRHGDPPVWKRRRRGLHYAHKGLEPSSVVIAHFRPRWGNLTRPWRLRDMRGISDCRSKPAQEFESFHRTLRSAKRHAQSATWHLEN